MHSAHVLRSRKDGGIYIGHSNNVKKRVDEHNNGQNVSTRDKKPWALIFYCESCQKNAIQREVHFKTR